MAWLGSQMSASLRLACSAEDLWQETLAHAWRDRQSHAWQGLPAFRGWLRGIAMHRLFEASKRMRTQKRGQGQAPASLSDELERSGGAWLPSLSTTPSRQVYRRERAQALQQALESLSADLRELVRMCLFEECSVAAAAQRLGLTESTAYRRLLRGAELFRASLARRLGDSSSRHESPT